MGMGTAPIGNLYRNVPVETAVETVQFALSSGITLFDTAPLYGLGMAEERLGIALQGVPRQDFTISTKIGRIPNQDRSDFTYDYSYDGVMRSLDGSLQRLGLDSVEILHIHEADPNTSQEEALAEAFPALLQLREQGVIQAIGAGMNEWSSLQKLVDRGDLDFDLFLLAGRYTLLEQGAFEFLNLCYAKNIAILAAGVYNSGILARGAREGAKYNYAAAPAHILSHAAAIASVCAAHNVPLAVAALQFVAAHPAVSSLVIGVESTAEVQANLDAQHASIPGELWKELQQFALIDRRAPVPRQNID